MSKPPGQSARVAALREKVQLFVETEAIPREDLAHIHDPLAMDRTLAELRFIAKAAGIYLPQMPEQYGGLGLSWVERAGLLEVAGHSYLGPGALNCAAPDQPNMISLMRSGTLAQQNTYLRPLANGGIRSCFAMTEPHPGTGSDPSMLITTAVPSAGGWVINGHKWFITGAIGAQFSIMLVQTPEGPTQFIVDAENPGFKVLRAIRAMDPYAIGGHGEIELSNCFVSNDAVLGEVGKGLDYAQQRLESARLSHCMRLMGRAARALVLAQAYVNKRHSFGQRLAELQLVQAMVADSHIDLYASRVMTLDCAARMDAGLSVKTETAMTKVFVSEALNRVADRAAQMMGALGMSEDAPVSLILRELRSFRIYDGASELHRATLGRRFLKLSSSSTA